MGFIKVLCLYMWTSTVYIEIDLVISPVRKLFTENSTGRDFPGGPAVKTLRSQCRGPGFDPWSGN